MIHPKRRRRARMGTRTETRVRCQAHLEWIRGHICLADNGDCGGKMHAHHVRKGAQAGMSQKPGDDRAVPLCAIHHTEVHHGHLTFENKHGLDLVEIAATLWQRSPHRFKYENGKSAA